MLNLTKLAIVAMVGTIASPVAAKTITFDDGVIGQSLDGFYAGQGVTFSNTLFSTNYGLDGSSGAIAIAADNDLQTVFGADTPLIGTFSAAQTKVGIRGIDVGSAGVRLEAYDTANMLIGFDEFFGEGLGVGTFRDLSVDGIGITSFRLFQPGSSGGNNSVGDGIVLENLSFSSGVPEPGTWAMMISGFGLLGAALRRKQAAATLA